jgi:ADP-ribose pyrophosphatase YjhB (NUDIX family)
LNPAAAPRTSSHGERTRAGGFILRVHEGRLEVLLMRRFKPERGEYFVVPGGSVEDAERFEDAAKRELEEETGVQFTLERQLYESVNPLSGRVGHYFVARWNSGEPQLHHASPEARERQTAQNRYAPTWVAADIVCELPLYPTVIRARLCRDLLEGLPDELIRLEETD